MVNYKNGKIYKLVAGNLTYFGSTCNELYKRLNQHKNETIRKVNKSKSKILFETGDEVQIFLVEKYPCNDRIELLRRERFYIENNDCVNYHVPARSIKESNQFYYKKNKEAIATKTKNYRIKNKDKVKEWDTNWRENNREKAREKARKYYHNHKAEIKEKNKIYRETHREKLRERDRIRYNNKKLKKEEINL